ncbi:hypothetical protein A6X21_05995 [Planctopirus hydrillae]|uniref:Uncharacterized protein n=1 Tax=Planctopirus hydrillae TaxID=1841610 RepID=A0A1C3EBF0_9PLAN|nr:hypothetical protein A6X21_05995 [Planctopirus hydrillae]
MILLGGKERGRKDLGRTELGRERNIVVFVTGVAQAGIQNTRASVVILRAGIHERLLQFSKGSMSQFRCVLWQVTRAANSSDWVAGVKRLRLPPVDWTRFVDREHARWLLRHATIALKLAEQWN